MAKAIGRLGALPLITTISGYQGVEEDTEATVQLLVIGTVQAGSFPRVTMLALDHSHIHTHIYTLTQ